MIQCGNIACEWNKNRCWRCKIYCVVRNIFVFFKNLFWRP